MTCLSIETKVFSIGSLETVKGSQHESEHDHICNQRQSTVLLSLVMLCGREYHITGVWARETVLQKTRAGLPPNWKTQAQEQRCEVPPALSEHWVRCLWRLWDRQNIKTFTHHIKFTAVSAGIQHTNLVSLQWFVTYFLYIQQWLQLFRYEGFFTWMSAWGNTFWGAKLI